MIFSAASREIKVNLLAWGVLGLLLLFSASTRAQVTGATLSGTVTDTSGAIVPQTQISIKNVATGVSTTVTSDAAGFYTAPNLLPGTYEITASAPGFSTEVHTGVNLTVGAQQVLNFSLKVGEVTQRVEVTGVAPAVELASSTISAVVSSNTVAELPLNGRDWTQLATLQPGVNVIPTQFASGLVNTSRGNRGFGNQMTISGTRPQLNNYRLDGISIVDYAGGAPGSTLSITLGVDAVSEFSVLTANYSAEYGRTSGGIVNAITKSGTNQIHGDAYEFVRNSAFDARNFFDGQIPPFRRNQFGGSVGGPIQKDKTFFFADYEGLRQSKGITNVNKVPSPDARNGIIHNADGSTTVIAVSPLVQPFLGLYALPNAGLIGTGNTGLYDVAITNIARENFETVKIDRKFSQNDSLAGTWFYDTGLNEAPDSLNTLLIGNTSARQMVALEETHVFSSSLVNSVRAGWSRVDEFSNISESAINPLVTNTTTLSAIPGQTAPAITVTGLTKFGGGFGGLSATNHPWNSVQVYDDAFFTKSTHSLKFGFAFERMQYNRNHITPTAPNGNFTFTSLTNFLTNKPSIFLGNAPGSVTAIENRQSLFGGYFQDDWRLRPNLTVNLGLRYEMVTAVTDSHNLFSNLQHFTDPLPPVFGPIFTRNPTLRNFEPRLGFSWDPSHNGKTAVRGAFGIFDALPLIYEIYGQILNEAPATQQFTAANLPAGVFPTGETSAVSAANINQSLLKHSSMQTDPSRNYVMIWNLNVQQQLTPSTTMTIGYVGNRGVHMVNRSDDGDDVLPVSTPQGLLWPSPIGSGARLNPNTSVLDIVYWGGDSFYDALQLQVSKRLSHGFQVQGSYTWGKSIDTGSASSLGDPFTNSIPSLFWFCKTCRRGLSDFDIAQTLVVNYIWDAPTPKNLGAIASHVLGGWEVGGIITAETGVPITPLIGGDPLGLNSSDPFAFPNHLTGPGCANPVNPNYRTTLNYINLSCFAVPMATPAIAAQCTPFATVPGSCSNLMGNAGRNTLVGPGLATFDFSLFKNNYIRAISENFNVQFRAEFFNALNRANFGTPTANETLFLQNGSPVGGAGAVSLTSTTSREIQFALKVIF